MGIANYDGDHGAAVAAIYGCSCMDDVNVGRSAIASKTDALP